MVIYLSDIARVIGWKHDVTLSIYSATSANAAAAATAALAAVTVMIGWFFAVVSFLWVPHRPESTSLSAFRQRTVTFAFLLHLQHIFSTFWAFSPRPCEGAETASDADADTTTDCAKDWVGLAAAATTTVGVTRDWLGTSAIPEFAGVLPLAFNTKTLLSL